MRAEFLQKLSVAILICNLFVSSIFAQTFEWAKRIGAAQFDLGYSITTDLAGNVFVSGKYEDKANFSGTFVSCAGNHDIYIAKYNSSGTLKWVRTAGGTVGDYARAITCDSLGNLYITGEFETKCTFVGTSVTLESHGDNDIFIAKYSNNGDFQWAKAVGGGPKSDRGYGITYSRGHIYVTGNFQDSAWFNKKIIASKGGYDIFMAKYTVNGEFKWLKTLGGTGHDEGWAIHNDQQGFYYMTGYFNGSMDFGGATLTSSGGNDVFLAKYNFDGNLIWVRKFGGAGHDAGMGVKLDKPGRIYLTGNYAGPASFGGFTLNASGGKSDIFTACIDNNGNTIWVKGAGGSGDDHGRAISTDKNSNVFVTGNYANSANFSGRTVVGADPNEIFFASYDKNGNIRWASGAGGIADEDQTGAWVERGLSVCTDTLGNTYFSGGYRSNTTFGSLTLVPYGHTDVYFVKVKPDPLMATINPSGTINICNGSGPLLQANEGTGYIYKWMKNGNIISGAISSSYKADSSGNYSVKIKCGKDSVVSNVVSVNMMGNVNPQVSPAGSQTICKGTSVTFSTQYASGYSYQWRRNGYNIIGATSYRYNTSNAGEYDVRVTAGSCSGLSPKTSLLTKRCRSWKIGEENDSLEINSPNSSSRNSSGLVIYPNPNSGIFTIEVNMFNTAEVNGSMEIAIINELGQLVYSKEIQYLRGSISEVVDLNSNVPSGIYKVKVKAGNKVKLSRVSLIR